MNCDPRPSAYRLRVWTSSSGLTSEVGGNSAYCQVCASAYNSGHWTNELVLTLKHSHFPDTPSKAFSKLKELFEDNSAYVASLKATKELAGEAGDNATDGIIDDWTDQAEQRAWFLREIIA